MHTHTHTHIYVCTLVQITEEDIELTFGGTDSRSRGYYSSMYASSANAYMLMYRRIDLGENRRKYGREGGGEGVRGEREGERGREGGRGGRRVEGREAV